MFGSETEFCNVDHFVYMKQNRGAKGLVITGAHRISLCLPSSGVALALGGKFGPK